MNYKLILNQVKALVGVEVKLETMELEGGAVLEAEVFEAGAEVFVITQGEEGAEPSKIPVPVGEYQLPDGGILKVEEEGIIASIGEAEAPAEETEEASAEEAPEPEVEASEEATAPKKIVKSVSEETHFSKIAELEATIAERDATIVELSKTPEVTETVELETADIKHSPEKSTGKKVALRKVNLQQTAKTRVYARLFGNN